MGAIELSRAYVSKDDPGLVLATAAYNLVAIPVAALLFVRMGARLPMSRNEPLDNNAADAQLLRLKLQPAPS